MSAGAICSTTLTMLIENADGCEVEPERVVRDARIPSCSALLFSIFWGYILIVFVHFWKCFINVYHQIAIQCTMYSFHVGESDKIH